MKKLGKYIAIFLALITIFNFGCQKKSKDDLEFDYPSGEKQQTVSLSSSRLDLTVGDFASLVATDYVYQDGLSLIWESADENIATVSGGKVEAINQGSTKISVTYGTAKATCDVNVVFGNTLPELKLNVTDGKLNITNQDKFNLVPQIKFRNRTFTDGQFEYEVEDQSVLTVENGIITPLLVGETSITVKAMWRNKTVEQSPLLLATIAVSVKDNVLISANSDKGLFELYTLSSWNGRDYNHSTQIVPSVEVNGQKIDNPDLSIFVVDSNICEYDVITKTLSGKAYGQTYVNVQFNYQEEIYNKQFEVHVLRPLSKFDRQINYFNSYTGALKDETDSFKTKTLAEIVFEKETNKTIVEAYDGTKALTVKDNFVFDISGLSTDKYEKTIKLCTTEVEYEVQLTVYGMYIYTPADLNVFVISEDSTELDCYVELGKNIDATGYNLPAHTAKPSHDRGANVNGFTGTFDGKGYAISNLTVNTYGLFNSITGGTVKNVGFMDCVIRAGQQECSSLIAYNVDDAIFENVYIRINNLPLASSTKSAKVVASNTIIGGSFKNVVIEHNEDVTWSTTSLYASFGPITPNKTLPTFSDCYVISKVPLGSVNYTQDHIQMTVAENISDEEFNRLSDALWEKLHVLYQNYLKNMDGRKYRLNGIKSYATLQDMQNDANSNKESYESFSPEYWTVSDGRILWGKNNSNIQDGEIILDLGIAKGKQVTGLTSAVITAKAGDMISLPTSLSCLGLKFVGWKNQLGQSVENGFTYDGKAMMLTAVWEEDDSYIETPYI